MSTRKKIDISKAQGAQLTSQGSNSDLAYLKANGARALPPNPTANKWSAEAILKQLYKQPEILFAWLKKNSEALLDLAVAVDDYLDTEHADTVHKSGTEVITGSKSFGTSGSDNSKTLDIYFTVNLRGPVWSNTILPGNTFSLGSAEHYWGAAYIDEIYVYGKFMDGYHEWTLPSASGQLFTEERFAQHHRFITDDGYVAQVLPDGESPNANNTNVLMNHADGIAITDEVKQLKEAIAALLGVKSNEYLTIEKILDGHITTGHATESNRAHMDMDGDHIDVSNYAKTVTLSYDSTNGKVTAKLFNQAGVEISSNTVDLPAELVFTNQYYDSANKKLVFVPASGGSNIEISLSDLVDTYTAGTDSDGICVVTINDHTIKVSIADGSISMAKLSSTLQSTWNGWVSAEADRVLAENGRVAAEAQRVLNENARLARPYLDIEDGYLTINYGTGHSITID